VWAAVWPSASQDRTAGRLPDAEVEPFPESKARAVAIEARRGVGQANHGGGIARGANVRLRHPLGQRGAEDGGQSGRAAREGAAPSRDGRASQRPPPGAPAKRAPRGAFRGASDEDLLQNLAANFHRVVRAGLLEGRQGRERGVGRLRALVAAHCDVLGDGVEKDEVAEVVAVLGKAAILTAAQTMRRTRQIESSLPRQAAREFGIGLERRAFRAYGDRSFRSSARAKMRQHDRSGAFSLDRR
jgi:hypothetical protein